MGQAHSPASATHRGSSSGNSPINAHECPSKAFSPNASTTKRTVATAYSRLTLGVMTSGFLARFSTVTARIPYAAARDNPSVRIPANHPGSAPSCTHQPKAAISAMSAAASKSPGITAFSRFRLSVRK